MPPYTRNNEGILVMVDELNKNTFIERIIEFIVVGSIFYITSHIIPTSSESNILIYSVVYSSIVFFSVCIGKHLVSVAITSSNPVICLMLRNATGLFIGTCIMLVLGIVISAIGDITMTVILASVITFFVLGTLSPLARPNSQGPTTKNIVSY